MTDGPFLIPVLGDQLTPDIAALRHADKARSVVLMMEVGDETRYVRHHKAKIAFILSAMRHHADRLRALGWTVDYVKLDDPANSGSFTAEVARAIARRMILFEKHETLVERSLTILTRFCRGVDTRRQVSVSPKSRSARTAVVAPEARARGAFQRAVGVFQPPRRRARRFRA